MTATAAIRLTVGEVTMEVLSGQGRVPGVAMTNATRLLMRQIRSEFTDGAHKKAPSVAHITVDVGGQTFVGQGEGKCPGSAISDAIIKIMKPIRKAYPRRERLRIGGVDSIHPEARFARK